MSIQTDLTRITNAKTAIKTAIEGKGVTVPAGTLLDGMAALIESIEAGGGGGYELKTGTVTIAEDITGQVPLFEVETNDSGIIPDFLMFHLAETAESIVDKRYILSYRMVVKDSAYATVEKILEIYKYSTINYYPNYVLNPGNLILTRYAIKNGQYMFPETGSGMQFRAGETYQYTALYGDISMWL